MTVSTAETAAFADYRAAKEALAHRVRPAAVIDVEGADRSAFLQGQLTQDVRSLSDGQVRPAAGLTPKGKLLYIARVIGLADRLRLLLTLASREATVAHLKKYAVFQKVSISDRSDDYVRIGLYGPDAASLPAPEGVTLDFLPGEGEFSREILCPAGSRGRIEAWLEERGSAALGSATAEGLRVEAGRPRFGQDANESYLADEVGLDPAISTTKGCYVGQEIVARMRTYGRVNRRLVGFRFVDGPIAPGTLLTQPGAREPEKIEQGRVTSSAVSPAAGAIGLGYAFRDVAPGATLVSSDGTSLSAVVAEFPLA